LDGLVPIVSPKDAANPSLAAAGPMRPLP
jgi:hypothetical protein